MHAANGVSLDEILYASCSDCSPVPGEAVVDASGLPRRLTGPGGKSGEAGIWNLASDGELDFFPESTAFLNENAEFMAENEDIVAGYFSRYDDSSSIQISSSSSDGFSSVPYQHHLIDEVAGYGFGLAAQLITGGFSYFGLAGGAIESVFNGEWSDGRSGDFALSRAKQFGEVGASLTSWMMPDERSWAYQALATTNELLSPVPPYIPGAGALASSIGSVAGYSRAVAGGLSDGSLSIALQNPYEGAVFGTFVDPTKVKFPLRLDISNASTTEFVGPLIGRSGFKSLDDSNEVAFQKNQKYVDDAYETILRKEARGALDIPDGIPRDTYVGQLLDDDARRSLRGWLRYGEGINEAPDSFIQVNRWLRDPSGSGNYRIPDFNVNGASHIYDLTIGNKSWSTPQVQDFYNFSGGSRITIVKPSREGGSFSIVPPNYWEK